MVWCVERWYLYSFFDSVRYWILVVRQIRRRCLRKCNVEFTKSYVRLSVEMFLFLYFNDFFRVAVLSQVMLTFAVTFTFCLQFYIPIKITWAPIMRKYNFKHPVFFELIYRTIICIIICEYYNGK